MINSACGYVPSLPAHVENVVKFDVKKMNRKKSKGQIRFHPFFFEAVLLLMDKIVKLNICSLV